MLIKHYIALATALLFCFSVNAARTKRTGLNNVIERRVREIFVLHNLGTFAMHVGRKSLLNQMEKEPNQLNKDLPRIPNINIGKRSIKFSNYINKSAEKKFLIVANNLEKYIYKKAGNIDNKGVVGRLGQFWTVEILYGLVQTFAAPAVQMAYENQPLASGQWASNLNESKQSAAFILETPTILSLSSITEKDMRNINDNNKKNMKFVINNKLYFDLKTGEVNFEYTYILDGNGKTRIYQVFE